MKFADMKDNSDSSVDVSCYYITDDRNDVYGAEKSFLFQGSDKM